MNLFGKEPQEQAMQKLVHDLNNATSNIYHYMDKLVDWLKENAKDLIVNDISTSVPFVIIEKLKRQAKDIQNAQDKYYNKFKEDFKE